MATDVESLIAFQQELSDATPVVWTPRPGRLIHTPRSGEQQIFDEVARVLRPGGHVLVGPQAGGGTPGRIASSVTGSSWSVISTRRIRSLPRYCLPA